MEFSEVSIGQLFSEFLSLIGQSKNSESIRSWILYLHHFIDRRFFRHMVLHDEQQISKYLNIINRTFKILSY